MSEVTSTDDSSTYKVVLQWASSSFLGWRGATILNVDSFGDTIFLRRPCFEYMCLDCSCLCSSSSRRWLWWFGTTKGVHGAHV
jgi:hypothetical protein